MSPQFIDAPGPSGRFPLANLFAFRKSPLRFFAGVTAKYGDTVRIRFPGWTGFVIAHPDQIRHVLLDNHKNFRKRALGVKVLRSFIGSGLLSSEGEFWLRQRRIAQPGFHRDRIASFAISMVRAAEDVAERWRGCAKRCVEIDVAADMVRMTLRIVSKTLLSYDLSGDEDHIGHAFSVGLEEVMKRVLRTVNLPLAIPTPSNLRFTRSLKTLNSVVTNMIAERRRDGRDRGDLLSMLMEARDEATGESMSDTQLRDEVMTIFFAGHDTTAFALTWTWFLLAKHPAVATRLRAELRQELGGRSPTAADLPRLTYTRWVVEEAMRLYPPVWGFVRSAIDDDALGDYHLPARSIVFISPYVTHRHPRLWENPERFDPTRFAPDKLAAMPRFSYLPFGGGPRLCIGNNFALMEATLVVSTIAQSVELDLVPGVEVEPVPLVTLRPRHGLRMFAHELPFDHKSAETPLTT